LALEFLALRLDTLKHGDHLGIGVLIATAWVVQIHLLQRRDDGTGLAARHKKREYRTRRRGNFLVRLLGIYLLIQIVAMLFGSCGYRGAYYDPYYYRNYSYSDSGTYSGQNQSQTGSDTGSGSWY